MSDLNQRIAELMGWRVIDRMERAQIVAGLMNESYRRDGFEDMVWRTSAEQYAERERIHEAFFGDTYVVRVDGEHPSRLPDFLHDLNALSQGPEKVLEQQGLRRSIEQADDGTWWCGWYRVNGFGSSPINKAVAQEVAPTEAEARALAAVAALEALAVKQ